VRRVLIVDDELVVAEVIVGMLERKLTSPAVCTGYTNGEHRWRPDKHRSIARAGERLADG
jgi:CheY-like chemotaxis protein